MGMFGVFEYLIMIPIFLIISYVIWKILYSIKSPPVRTLVMILGFVGVFAHEFSHALTSVLVGVRPRAFQVHMYSRDANGDKRGVGPHGFVEIDTHNMTFLQAFFICTAPIFVCTWLFFWSLGTMLSDKIDMLPFFLSFFLCFSLLMGAPPSYPDFRIVWNSFKVDPQYALYQMGLLFISGAIVWGILTFYRILLPVDLIYYILVGLMYYPVKYIFQSFGYFVNLLKRRIGLPEPEHTEQRERDYKSFTHRRYKPRKPYREPQF